MSAKPCDNLNGTCEAYPMCECGRAWRSHTAPTMTAALTPEHRAAIERIHSMEYRGAALSDALYAAGLAEGMERAVPREPTEIMLRSAYRTCGDFIDEHGNGEASNLDDGQWNDMMAAAWRVMYDAAKGQP